MILAIVFISSSDGRNFVIQLVASADCAGALDVTDDLLHLLVFSRPMNLIIFMFKSIMFICLHKFYSYFRM